ncbi:MAG: small basic protein [Candidatus Omnitrophica bacterium]|nr:small basic protein [Candidatus Omnitrophota bacterium]MCM8826133.1 small basic protein [Candidatus Omnitrophota bacterium]
MSLHPSLQNKGKRGFFRTVLNRTERIKLLIEKGEWNKEQRVVGLPKVKIVRMKISKKDKTAPQQEKKETDTQQTSAK